jgi:hypothetical protein
MDSTAIWGIVGSVVSALLAIVLPIIKIKSNKYLNLLHMIIDAFEDDKVDNTELAAIIKAAKSLK